METIKTLFCDLETYSDIDLRKAGLYKYVQSPAFQIMLCAYSFNGGPVKVVDLIGNPEDTWTTQVWASFISVLTDPNVIKYAHNAAFEIACLSRALGVELDPSQWRDTMLMAQYCGLPASLDAVGKALGFPGDKQKKSIGTSLIRYFCLPCKPTKTNGGRTRNLPHHDSGKWALFKDYCAGDVVAEMEITRRLTNFPVPAAIQKQWETDLRINRRGVAVDMKLVTAAIEIDEAAKAVLVQEAMQLSGLENPGSRKQLLAWLEEELNEELPDLRKDTVAQLLTRDLPSDKATRLLQIRQEASKTSTKKYNAIAAAVGVDGRVRGLLKFYGANRTGRWAGAIVQPQNLPRTYISPLPIAREFVKQRRADGLALFWGSVPDTLSQLIRTAFIAAPGHVFIDADFSSIEARVLSWLAGEEWRMEVFRTHGRIYEASAAAMFNVALELISKGNPEYALRQKGKIAELALGYQGAAPALIQMGALKMGLAEEELPDIVFRWRKSNSRIVNLWYNVEAAAISAMQGGRETVNGIIFAREIDDGNGLDFLTITLPSGRKLFYAHPALGENQWGKPAITYQGVDQKTSRWKAIETYGGKLVENIVQAIARDCLAEAVERLEATGYMVVFHVHDEVVIEAPAVTVDSNTLDSVIAIMAQPIPWAPGLPMGADGWIDEFYKKD